MIGFITTILNKIAFNLFDVQIHQTKFYIDIFGSPFSKAVSQLGWLKVKFLIVVNMEFKYFTSPGASDIF
jgi:hypothetical protein